LDSEAHLGSGMEVVVMGDSLPKRLRQSPDLKNLASKLGMIHAVRRTFRLKEVNLMRNCVLYELCVRFAGVLKQRQLPDSMKQAGSITEVDCQILARVFGQQSCRDAMPPPGFYERRSAIGNSPPKCSRNDHMADSTESDQRDRVQNRSNLLSSAA